MNKKVILFLLSFICSAFLYADNKLIYNEFKSEFSGVWGYQKEDKRHFGSIFNVGSFSTFYEISPFIMLESTYVSGGYSDKKSLEELYEMTLKKYKNTNMYPQETIYIFDEKLGVFYRWSLETNTRSKQFVAFDAKNKIAYVFPETEEVKKLLNDGLSSHDYSSLFDSYGYVKFQLDENSVKPTLKKYVSNGMMRFFSNNIGIVERIHKSYEAETSMNIQANYYDDNKKNAPIYEMFKDLFGQWQINFADGRILYSFINFASGLRFTYYENINNEYKLLNDNAFDLFSPNGRDLNLVYDGVSPVNFPHTVLSSWNVGGLLVLAYRNVILPGNYKDPQIPAIKSLYAVIKEGDSFIFYTTTPNHALEYDQLVVADKDTRVRSLVKDLKPIFKMKFSKDSIIGYRLEDEKWVKNFEMIRVSEDNNKSESE